MGFKAFISDLYDIKSTGILDPSAFSGYTGVMSSSVAGVKVNQATSIAHDTVYSCIRDKAQTLGQLPIILKRKGKKVTSGREFRILTQKINEFQTVSDFIEMLVTVLELNGNFYAEVDRNKHENISSVTPLFNQVVGVNRDFAGRIVYTYVSNDGKQVTTFPSKDFIHIKQNSLNGYTGLSPLGCKRAIGIGIAQDTHLSKVMENGAAPSGVLETDNFFQDVNDATRIREDFDKKYAGVQKSGKTVLLENGLKFKPISISPADAELLEERRYNRETICGIFGVPVHRIGGTANAKVKDVGQENTDYYVNKLMPIGGKIEDAINFVLPDGLTVELDPRGFTRGDSKSQSEVLSAEFKTGSISMNEMREGMNRDAIEGGDYHAIDTNNFTFGLPTDIPRLQEENRALAMAGAQQTEKPAEEDNDE